MEQKTFAANWEKALNQGYMYYLQKTSRSDRKVDPLHNFLKGAVEDITKGKLKVLINGRKPFMKIKGKIFDKECDMIIKKRGIKAVLSSKWIMQNYRQNAHNYLENLIGETVNIKLTGVKFIYLLIVCNPMPYYDKKGHLVKLEKFTQEDEKPYNSLKTLHREVFAPDYIHIEKVRRNRTIGLCDTVSLFNFLTKTLRRIT